MITARRLASVIFGWAPEKEVSETAWLNGVRGLAAFCVMISHFNLSWLSDFAEAPFGAAVLGDRVADDIWYFQDGQRLWAPWRLPILRSFMASGGAQVALFFVISGFALTWSPLQSVHNASYEKLYQQLGSSTIRRWLRLYLPCIAISIAYLLHGLFKKYNGFLPMLEQIRDFCIALEEWANPFRTFDTGQIPMIYAYINVIWTIPLEFSGSIFVYVMLLGLGRVQSFPKRITTTFCVTLAVMLSHRWGLWLFGCGMMLADYVRHRGGFQRMTQTTSAGAKLFWTLCLAVSYLLLSFMPSTPLYSRPGYEWTQYVPLPYGWRSAVGEQRFWWGCGGVLMIASACHLRWVRRFFELPFLQHLGKISFMLYLIHFMIHHLVGYSLRMALFAVFCRWEHDDTFDADLYRSNAVNNIGIWIVLCLVTVPLTLAVAHFLEVLIDRPSTAFGKWLDNKLTDRAAHRKEPLVSEEEQLLESRSSDGVLEMGEIPHNLSSSIPQRIA